ncbi:DNA transposition protein, AAA+ family ATPase [Epilithonimonas zeae]|uniref:DNA transposition protein, AAA+ family ATPase n=2 Tax=Epilithonimonas zeae TaxID=1416779 RepID=A0A1N6GXJ3_9FLAO|nr:DNA transposition protein, AAA+ family ATPase [Epilithonimonas zeae]
MNKDLKLNITEKLEDYLKKNEMSANEFSDSYNIPSNYISQIRNGKDFVMAGEDKKVMIHPKYYRQIAKSIGFKMEKEYWRTKVTPQFNQILGVLEDAKEFGYTNIIIGETGCGKSYLSDLFVKSYIKDAFKITVGSMDTISDLLDKICESLKIQSGTSKSKRIKDIIKKLTSLKLEGYEPILIFDEAEYLKQSTLCNMKELHDHLNQHCGLILIGTDQLIKKLEQLRKKNKDGMPQFYSRIKFGIRYLKSIDTNFSEFVGGFQDKDLVKFLQNYCTSYRELHDVLVPAMREADRLREPLTENLVRKVLNLPPL